jgi:hypothetical protein
LETNWQFLESPPETLRRAPRCSELSEISAAVPPGLEIVQELPLRHRASEWAIDCGVGHVAVSHAGDHDLAPDVFTPPAAVDGDGWSHCAAQPFFGTA